MVSGLPNIPIFEVSGPGGAREYSITESYPTFVSILAYPEKDPKVIVKRKVMWRNGQWQNYVSIFEMPEALAAP